MLSTLQAAIHKTQFNRIKFALMAAVLAFSSTTAVLAPNLASASTTNLVKNVNTGEEFSTIQAAIDDEDTLDGHKILVFDGTYEENVSIDKNITLMSKNGPASTTIAPTSGHTVELLGDHANMADVTIRGFTLTSGSSNAIILQANSQANDGYDYTNLHYRDLVINANGSTGIGLFDVDGIKIRNVTINNASYGIEAIGVKKMDIRNSSISSSNRGLNVNVHPGYEDNTKLRIQNNTFTDNGQSTTVNGAHDVTYIDNTISGGYLGLTLQSVDKAKVKNNSFTSLDGGDTDDPTGVWLHDGTHDIAITNNTFSGIDASGMSAQAILVGDSESSAAHDKIAINNNTVDGVSGNPGGYGVMVNFETTRLAITQNTFKNISGGDWMAGVGLDAPTPGARVNSNNFSDLSAGDYPEVAINVNLREGNTAHASTFKIQKNNFYLTDDQYGVAYDLGTETPLGTLKAKKNYWNDMQGPSGSFGEADSAGALVSDNVTYSPWLCYPAPSNKTTTNGNDCDTEAPAAPEITSPGERTWHKTAPITNSWTEVSDDSGIDYYQIAYHYDDGHSFGGSTCTGVTMTGYTGFIGCRDVNGTSRNHAPADWEQGGVTIWVRAIDNAGNVGPWSDPVHYYYDHESPVTSIVAPTGVVGNSFTIEGEATDNLALNRVYVQLVNREDNKRYGGTTINLIPEGDRANWSRTYKADVDGLPEGTYAAHVAVVDRAGNKSTAGWTADFTIDTTPPEIEIKNILVSLDKKLSFDLFATDTGPAGLKHVAANIYDEDNVVKVIELGSGNPTRLNVPHDGLSLGTPSFDTSLNDIDVSGLTTGTYTIRAFARDHANNELQFELAQFTVDNTDPAVDAGADETVDGLAYSLSGTASDGETGLAGTLWTLESGPGTASADFDDDTAPGTNVIVSAVGTYTFKLTATDNAGNTAEDTVTIKFNPVQGASTADEDKDDEKEQSSQNSFVALNSAGGNNTEDKEDKEKTEEKAILSQTDGEDGGETKDTEVITTTSGSSSFFSNWWWALLLAALLIAGYFYATRVSKSKK